jgi:predicted RNA-binding protein YlxR (DUF448 family)
MGDGCQTEFFESNDKLSSSMRRCFVTGKSYSKETLLRFVVDPHQKIVADITGRLPGRGFWLSSQASIVKEAVVKGLFSKVTRQKVETDIDLSDQVSLSLQRRCLELIGLARRAGQAIAGYEKVVTALRSGQGGILLSARDGSVSSFEKIRSLAPQLPLLSCLDAVTLGGAFGRDHVVNGLVLRGQLAEKLRIESDRLSGFMTEK